MTQPAKVQEPSMEEILASIRRIIADDEANPADAAGAGAGVTLAVSTDRVTPRPESVAPRLHNIASVTPQVAVSQPVSGRGEAHAMAVVATDRAASPSTSAMSETAASGKSSLSAGNGSATLDDVADVFDLTDEMALPSGGSAFRTVDPKDDLEFAGPPISERREPPKPRVAAPAAAPAAPDPADILSQHTASAVESAFNSLASTVLSANSRTLEDLVKEMMRPMLKNWLDDNLPGLVERIVKTEIERVARGR